MAKARRGRSTDLTELEDKLALLHGQYERLRRSVVLFRDLVSVTDTGELCDALLDGITREFPVLAAFIGRVHPQAGVVRIVSRREDGRGRAPDEIPLDHPLIARLLESPEGNLHVTSRSQAGTEGFFYANSQSLVAVKFRFEGDAPDILVLEAH